jgi:hypothetical protein
LQAPTKLRAYVILKYFFCSSEFRVVAGDDVQKLLDFVARRKPLVKVLVQGVETF